MQKILDKPFLLILYGPTGVGKSDAALSIAQHIPAEIINMDVGQFYTPLSIGTAKPAWKESSIPHHLFDIIDEPRNFTVVEYRKLLLIKAQEIWTRNKLPIVVGGSGFYLKSLFFSPITHTKKKDFVALYPKKENLWDELYKIDPERALSIDRGDTYRIKRALEIWHVTGKPPRVFAPTYNPPADYMLIFLTRDKEDLHKRINLRTGEMIKEGWIQEVERLQPTEWEQFINEKKLIGYNELLEYLQGEKSEKALLKTIEAIKIRTRNYAKRQRTFWRMLKREISKEATPQNNVVGCLDEVNLTNQDIRLYINELLQLLSYL